MIMLVRGGAAIPRAELAQSTDRIDWSEVELVVFGGGAPTTEGLVRLSGDDELHRLRLERDGDSFALEGDHLQSSVAFKVVHSA